MQRSREVLPCVPSVARRPRPLKPQEPLRIGSVRFSTPSRCPQQMPAANSASLAGRAFCIGRSPGFPAMRTKRREKQRTRINWVRNITWASIVALWQAVRNENFQRIAWRSGNADLEYQASRVLSPGGRRGARRARAACGVFRIVSNVCSSAGLPSLVPGAACVASRLRVAHSNLNLRAGRGTVLL